MQLNLRRLRFLSCSMLFVACALGAHAGITSKRLLAAIVERTPAPRLVNEGEQMRAAELAAKALPAAHVLWGVGRSMEPLYAHNTAIVVSDYDYEKLKKGMTVVYVKRNGMRVAHCIVGETRGGYLVQGINNDEEDAELITPKNFIGIIVDAYASTTTDFRDSVQQRVASTASLQVASVTNRL